MRGLDGLKEDTLTIKGTELRVAVVHGAKRFKKVCDDVRAGMSPYQFIQFIAFPGGCVCGGGQPIMPTLLEQAPRRAPTRYATLRHPRDRAEV